ncbi:hypothetical protein CEXT_736791 [Caerostris extrusa]|uniref:Uncharacterized protein n=1 Tax=Caerostris extrusa TaxID=172846 RepID=A0AAV4VKT4_CAEEX|nr:hypothetical protein CEXT_736791 [Caerostris extrusa]
MKNNHGESQISDPKPGIPRSQSSKSETTTVSSKRQRNKDEYSAQKPAKIRRKEKGKNYADFSTSEDEGLSSDSDIKLDIKITVNIRSFTELRETASVSQRGILERATPDKLDINYLSYAALRVSSKKC